METTLIIILAIIFLIFIFPLLIFSSAVGSSTATGTYTITASFEDNCSGTTS